MTDFKQKTQVDNQSTQDVVDYHKALLLQKEQELTIVKKQLAGLVSHNNSLVSSVSYKAGRMITLPARIIVGLFTKKKVSSNPIKASLDSALIANGLIEVSGWALSDCKIKSVEIFLNNNYCKSAQLGLFRNDVVLAFSDIEEHSEFSGFSALISGTLTDELSVKVIDGKGNIIFLQKVIVPAISAMHLNSQYEIMLLHNILKNQKTVTHTNKKYSYQPLISIVVPVFNVNVKWLEACIKSVVNQLYSNWQLCLYADDAIGQDVLACITKWRDKDSRIYMVYGKNNKGISLLANEVLKLAQGEFVAFLTHNDELSLDALMHVVKTLNQNKKLDFMYSDEDKIDAEGQLCDPHFKSDFNLETLLSHNYICHFSVIRKSLGDKIGWFRESFEGSQDYDLFLRIVTKTIKIWHIPKVLYHCRKVTVSTAIATKNKAYAQVTGKQVVVSYLYSQNIQAEVEAGLFPNSYRVKYFAETSQLVSIIIPFRNGLELLKGCVESILNKTSYANYEILLIDNQSDDNDIIAYCQLLVQTQTKIKLYQYNETFNFAKINNFAVSKAQGDLLLFLNNDTKVINNDWLREMVSQIQQDNVAAVGAKLLFADDTIQHSGIIVSKAGAVHPNKGLADLAVGYFQRANYVQYVSACTAACLLVNKSIFIEVGGFDEKLFAIAYNDVDLCLKIRQKGYKIVYTPYAKLYHYESKSRGLDDEPKKIARFTQELKNYQQKWGAVYQDGDPFYNPNLKQTSEKIYLNID
ncbi:MAG: glycosyltransferase family 2 protein [Proteobacteria bacterium]|nr:glycosyltransferase family 2 protein [Pseudomonadota bacterium]